MSLSVAKVAVPSKINRLFDYLTPNNLALPPGTRVRVSFGKRKIIATVVKMGDLEIEENKIKPILEILDESPFFYPPLFNLLIWTSEYYCYPLGLLIKDILPTKWFTKEQPSPRQEVRTKEERLILNEEQKIVVQTILKTSNFRVFCLYGVTGSGKTEVYLNSCLPFMGEGKQVLYLVPEINLTPQTITRIKNFFPTYGVNVYHSKLSPKEKAIIWQQASIPKNQIFVGTRSAVFLPFINLGLIIIDEEHDPSFKQQTKLRYSARDVAIMRAKLTNIPIILGSATPSLETLYNVWRQRYIPLTLPSRTGKAVLPTFKLVDLRGKKLIHEFTEPLLRKIEQKLQQKEQILIFLNRRGFAPILMCRQCGFTSACSRCDAKLTVHLQKQKIICHKCNSTWELPKICPRCGFSNLLMLGSGTEKLAHSLHKIFPQAAIARIDRDTTQTKHAFQEFLQHLGEYQILVGTQMLIKGHHFPNLTMVVIMDVDYPLLSFDYRAEETLAQQIIQVSGRAGRADKPGEVYLQTYNPEHPLLQKIVHLIDYPTLAKSLLQTRKQTFFPPFSYLAILQAESKEDIKAVNFLTQVKQQILLPNTQIHGPIPVTLHKKAGKYREQLLLQSKNRHQLRTLINYLNDYLNSLPPQKQLNWFLEIDPLNLNT